MSLLIYLVQIAYRIINFLIISRVLISWLNPSFYDYNWRKVLRFIYSTTEPILAPIRRLMPTEGWGLDFSPLIALLFLKFLKDIIISLLYSIWF